MGCQESHLNKYQNKTIAIVDPRFYKSQLEGVRQELHQNRIQISIYMSLEQFLPQCSKNDHPDYIVVQPKDLSYLSKTIEKFNPSPKVFVLTSQTSSEKSQDSSIQYFTSYEKLFSLIQDSFKIQKKNNQHLSHNKILKTKKEKQKICVKVLRDFQEDKQGTLFIFEEILKTKGISYCMYETIKQLQDSFLTSQCKFVLVDYQVHDQVVAVAKQHQAKVLCVCDMQKDQVYHPDVYFYSNSFQQIANQISFINAMKMPSLAVNKVFFYSKDQQLACSFCAPLAHMGFDIKFSKNIAQILRATRLYFSVMIVCFQQEKEQAQNQIQNEGCLFRVRLLQIEQICKPSLQSMKKVIRELKRGYMMKFCMAKSVDIIDRYHQQVKFAQIKLQLKKQQIEFKSYKNIKQYLGSSKFVSPFVICNYAQRMELYRYLKEVKVNAKIIVYCTKNQMNTQLSEDKRWVLASNYFTKIIKFIKKTPVLQPSIVTQEKQKIQSKQQKLKSNQHRVSLVKWANQPQSTENTKMPFITVKMNASSLYLKQIFLDSCSLLNLTFKPFAQPSKFKQNLTQSLQYLHNHHNLSFGDELVQENSVKQMSLYELFVKAREFLGNNKEVGMKLNDQLMMLENLDQKRLKHWKDIVFLLNLNFIGFYNLPSITKKRLVHLTSQTDFQQCLPEDTIVMKKYLVMYEQQPTEPPAGYIKLELCLDYSTLTDQSPQKQAFFVHNQRFIFAPMTSYKVVANFKHNEVITITLQLIRSTDFMDCYVQSNVDSCLKQFFQKQIQTSSRQSLGLNKQKINLNISRIQALSNYRKGNLTQAIKIQADLIRKQQQNQNFDQNYLGQLQFEMANYYFKQQSYEQMLRLLKEINQNFSNSKVKQETAVLLQKVIQIQNKQNKPQVRKMVTQKCIKLQEDLKVEESEQESQEQEREFADPVDLERQLQCLQLNNTFLFDQNFS